MWRKSFLLSATVLANLTASAELGAQSPVLPHGEETRTGERIREQSIEPGNCSALAKIRLVNTRVGSVTTIQNGQMHFCRVAAVSTPTQDSNINFEIWLPPPSRWNGKLYSSVGGASLGAIVLNAMQKGVERGYASMSEDRGHAGRDDKGSTFTADGSWAPGHPQKIIDWGYRAQHVSTVATKHIVAAYYGKMTQHSFFEGCGTGGQQAIMEAERFPQDFDGIIAAAPALGVTHAMASMLWASMPAQLNPQNAIPDNKLALLHKAALDACDGLDGVKDGLIGRPLACQIDPTILQCKFGDAAECLTPEQVQTAMKIYGGPKRSNGQSIAPGYLPGSEMGWAFYMKGTAPGMTAEFLRDWAFEQKDYDFRTFDFDSDWTKLNARQVSGRSLAKIVNPVGDLARYRQLNGKLLLWVGAADAHASPGASVKYYNTVVEKSLAIAPQETLRLFVAPGVANCTGGEGPDKYDMLGALENWVEHGRLPERINPSKPATERSATRALPLCPYPLVADYSGSGDVNDSDNFICINSSAGPN